MAPKTKYVLGSEIPKKVSESLKKYNPLTQRLLYNRGITNAEEAEIFLNPDYEEHLNDPFLFADMEKAVKRTLDAIKNNEHIAIYSDYDCDGIPGGVVLHDLFKAIGYENFENYIPHRHHDGYGFNADSVKGFKERDTKLIITVDCGIVDYEATEEANKAGIDVIITDHHEPNEKIPKAFAILNPKHGDSYPFKGLCGAGVAYKLSQALLERGREEKTIELKEGMEKWFLDMVGLATIADRVPLRDENRALAHFGLDVLRKSRRPGLQHLLRKSGGSQRHLTEEDIGFTIGPRINAASRMDDPEDAFHMLATKDEAEAGERVRHLEKLNNERKGVVAGMTKEAKKKMKAHQELPDVIVMGNPEWRPSLVGLVANSLADEFKRPVFLWGRDGKNVIKGSCRGSGEVSTLNIMEATPDTFIGFGGHHASGGFSVDDTKIHSLLDDLNEAYKSLGKEAYADVHEFEVDADISLEEIDESFMRTLKQLSPYGEANPKPLFRLNDVVPQKAIVFGKTNNHTKLIFETKKGRREAIAFFKTPEQFDVTPEENKPLTLIAHVEQSHFMGRMQTRLRIVDIL